jgi:predicted transcriptional regulator
MPDQLSLITTSEPTPIMLSLQPQYMQEIRKGTKRYEYRRKYRRERTRAFIYENAPLGAVTAVLELDEPDRRSAGRDRAHR